MGETTSDTCSYKKYLLLSQIQFTSSHVESCSQFGVPPPPGATYCIRSMEGFTNESIAELNMPDMADDMTSRFAALGETSSRLDPNGYM